MAEIRVEPKQGGAGRWLIPLLLVLAIAAAAYWYFGMRDGRATRDATPSDTAVTMPADTAGSSATSGATPAVPSNP
jgi:hypothetical protein